MNVSRELITSEAAPHGWFVIEGNPEVGYTLFRVEPSEVGHFKRKWQAVSQAKNGAIT